MIRVRRQAACATRPRFMNVPVLIAVTILYAAISAYGLYLIKDAPTLTTSRALIGGLLYGGGFCIWIAMLRVFPLSAAFPVAAGSLIIATHLIGRVYLAEATSSLQTFGIGLIIAGIFLVFLRTPG
jgi:multidrug transporter EmrE-like cation transporter